VGLIQNRNYYWKVRLTKPATLTNEQWVLARALASLLVIMAVLQLISVADFRDGLATMGLRAPSLWAVLVIVAELWAAAGFFKWTLSYGFRYVSTLAAILVAGFWFIMQIQIFANGSAEIMHSSYFFGSYLNQAPGWITIIETTVVFAAIIYTASLTQASLDKIRK
jgi:hypothetical protein